MSDHILTIKGTFAVVSMSVLMTCYLATAPAAGIDSDAQECYSPRNVEWVVEPSDLPAPETPEVPEAETPEIEAPEMDPVVVRNTDDLISEDPEPVYEAVSEPVPDPVPANAYYVINAAYGDSQAAVDAGTVNWYGQNWFMAHSNTADGAVISSLRPGDIVCANGVEYTIEGSTYCYWGEEAQVYLDRYAGRALFSTCADNSGTAYLFYSTL